MKGNTTLIYLGLFNNKIGNEGVMQIAEALKGNTTLVALDLADNNIDTAGATLIIEALKGSTALTCLEFGSKNPIDADGAEKLDAFILANPNITTASYNNMSDKAKAALEARNSYVLDLFHDWTDYQTKATELPKSPEEYERWSNAITYYFNNLDIADKSDLADSLDMYCKAREAARRKEFSLKAFALSGIVVTSAYALSASTSFPKVPKGLLCAIPFLTCAITYYLKSPHLHPIEPPTPPDIPSL